MRVSPLGLNTRSRRLLGGVGAGILVLALAGLGSGAASAETLKEALHATYKFNPRLDAARSIQRATDEEVPRALSGYRPSITGSADTGYEPQYQVEKSMADYIDWLKAGNAE